MELSILEIFVSSFFLGEYATIPLFILGIKGYADLKTIAITIYLASLSADLFWYIIARTFLKNYDINKWYEKANISNQKMFKFILDNNILFSITFIKFLIGLRLILTLSLILIKKLSFKEFLGFSILSNIFLIIGLYLIGLSVSHGLNLIPVYKGISGVISLIIITLVVVNIIQYLLKLYFIKQK